MRTFVSHKTIHLMLSIFLGIFSFWYLNFQVQRLAGWYIDDAGISFSYARNLLSWSLVHQIGAEPVEGFSNPLWVFITALVMRVLSNDIELLRTMSWFFIILTYARLMMSARNDYTTIFIHSLCIFLLATNPSIIIWSFSGLENSLYLLLGTEMLLRLCRVSHGITFRDAAWAGVASAGLLLTRPDGVLYAPLYAIVCIILHKKAALTRWKPVLISLLLPVVALLSYLLFRLSYFGDLFPNTYYAKGLPFTTRLFDFLTVSVELITLLRELMQGCFSLRADFLIFVPVAFLIYRYRKDDELVRRLYPIAIFLVCALFIYLYLPGDWMPELRFATLFFLPLYMFSSMLIMRIPSNWKYLGLMVCLFFSVRGSMVRMDFFMDNKPISIDEVKDRNHYFTNWAKKLNLNKPSILIADTGGALLEDTLTIVDLGMLCDKTIARSLGELVSPPKRKVFWDYIFDKKKPVFLSTRAYHAWIANLDGDPRFRRDYVAIREYRDLWVLRRRGEVVMAGDYVRKDVITSEANLKEIRNEAESIHYPFYNPVIK